MFCTAFPNTPFGYIYQKSKNIFFKFYNYLQQVIQLFQFLRFLQYLTKYINAYFILLNKGTGYMVILLSSTALLCGFTGSSCTISDIYSTYLQERSSRLQTNKNINVIRCNPSDDTLISVNFSCKLYSQSNFNFPENMSNQCIFTGW